MQEYAMITGVKMMLGRAQIYTVPVAYSSFDTPHHPLDGVHSVAVQASACIKAGLSM